MKTCRSAASQPEQIVRPGPIVVHLVAGELAPSSFFALRRRKNGAAWRRF